MAPGDSKPASQPASQSAKVSRRPGLERAVALAATHFARFNVRSASQWKRARSRTNGRGLGGAHF